MYIFSRPAKKLAAYLLLSLSLLLLCAGASSADATDTQRVTPTVKSLAEFPLRFVPNQGQWESEIIYASSSPQMDMFFASDALIMHVHGANRTASAVRVQPLNAQPTQTIKPGHTLPSRMSYLQGNDPTRWHTHIETYDSIRYQAIYPGIDWVFRSDALHLVHDFVVAPEADPTQIKLAIDGVMALEIDAGGRLVATLSDGMTLYQNQPFIYQDHANGRRQIDGGFKILRHDSKQHRYVIGFELGDYDHTLALVIDPTVTIEYSALLGGPGNDEVSAIAVTDTGEVIVVGNTVSSELPGQIDEYGVRARRDGLIYQLSEDGTTLDYVIVLGGSNDEVIKGLALHQDGPITSLYLTGHTNSTDFPVSNGNSLGIAPSGLYPVLPGGRAQAAFVAKLDLSNESLEFAGYFGGTGVDTGTAIDLDNAGNIYIAGTTASSDLPTRNALYPVYPRSRTGFVMKLSDDASFVHYATYLGGSGNDDVVAMQVIKEPNGIYDGTVYLAGYTASRDFPTTARALQQDNPGGTSGFIARIATQGTELVFSSYLGGGRNDFITDMVLDGDHHILLSGYTNSTNFPVTNALYPEHSGNTDAFIAKVDRFGQFLHFATYLGGLGNDQANAIAKDRDPDNGLEYIYVAGQTQSHNFPTLHAIDGHSYLRASDARSNDGFIAKLDPRGLDLIYSSFFGGRTDDAIIAAGTKPGDNRTLFIAGNTTARDDSDPDANKTLFPVPSDATESIQYHLASGAANSNQFVAYIEDLLYDRRVARLELNYVSTYPEEAVDPGDPDPRFVTLELRLRDPSSVEVAGFSTVLQFDPDKLGFDVVDAQGPDQNPAWGPDTGYPADARAHVEELLGPGEWMLVLHQDQAMPRFIATDTLLARLKFEVLDTEIFDSMQLPVRLVQSQTSGTNIRHQNILLRTVSGGILIDRACNYWVDADATRTLLSGDCDCSGRVTIAEVQAVASQILTAGNPRAPRCMDDDTPPQARPSSALNIMEVVNNHIQQPGIRTASAMLSQRMMQEHVASTASVEFGQWQHTGRHITTDLVLQSAGQSIAAVTTDVYYDPQYFDAITVTTGSVVRAANKNLSYNVVAPGRLRILVYGLNTEAISEGVIGTLQLTPNASFERASSQLRNATHAFDPQAQRVAMADSTTTLSGPQARLRRYLDADTHHVAVTDNLFLGVKPGMQYTALEIEFQTPVATLQLSHALARIARFRLYPGQTYTYTFNPLTGYVDILHEDAVIVSLPVDATGRTPEVSIGQNATTRLQVSRTNHNLYEVDPSSIP